MQKHHSRQAGFSAAKLSPKFSEAKCEPIDRSVSEAQALKGKQSD